MIEQKMKTFYYFAYGSNMYFRRLRSRTPSANRLHIGYVEGYRLTFNKKSSDGSGKCDCEKIDDATMRVFGVVYQINETDRHCLNNAEGLGKGYDDKEVTIIPIDGSESLVAVTFVATNKRDDLKPYDWYKEFVLRGAKENNLPQDYISTFIMSVDAEIDKDTARAEKNWAICQD